MSDKTLSEMHDMQITRIKQSREAAEASLASNDRNQAAEHIGNALAIFDEFPTEDEKLRERQACQNLVSRIFSRADQEAALAELETAKAASVDLLKSAGISRVVIIYDGCGDSGQISSIVASYTNGHEDVDIMDSGVAERGQEELVERLEDFVWTALALHRPGFEINEGGFGQITIQAEEGATKPFALEHTQYDPVTRSTEL